MPSQTTIGLHPDTRDAFKDYIKEFGYDSYEQAILDMLWQEGFVERPDHRKPLKKPHFRQW